MELPSEITEAMINDLGWRIAYLVTVLFFLFTTGLGILVFYTRGKLQQKLDEQERKNQARYTKLEQELQAKLDTKTHISKAQFDKEFEIV